MHVSRAALGKYLGTDADNLVYTQNVTISLNIVARSLELSPGDEVLSTDHEYGAMDRMWRFLSSQRGFSYVNRRIPLPLSSTEKFVEDFWRGVTPSTRVIFLSHVTSPTAILFPIAGIIRRARENGIITIIDGAHAPGQIPLDLDSLDADFYGGNLHKWLCAPKGAGFLYARPDMQHLLKPLVISWGYESDAPSGSTFIDHHEWWGTRDLAAFLSVPAAIEFQEKHNWNEVRAACHELASNALREIQKITGLPPLYPNDDWFAQMFSAPLPASVDVARLKEQLYEEYRIEVPVYAWNGNNLMRVSLQGYNDASDVNSLLNALRHMLSTNV
jgi:isopenicillin-N epimerase